MPAFSRGPDARGAAGTSVWNALSCGERSSRLINHLNGLFLYFLGNLNQRRIIG
jgi:hypothetical protein